MVLQETCVVKSEEVRFGCKLILCARATGHPRGYCEVAFKAFMIQTSR